MILIKNQRILLKGRQEGINALIRTMRKFSLNDDEILTQLMEEYELDENTAKQYMQA